MHNDKKFIVSNSWILPDSDKILRTKCKELILPLNSKQKELINKMVQYIDESYEISYKNAINKNKITPGVAIASNQVGLLIPVIYLKFNDENNNLVNYLLANPVIKRHSLQKCFLSTGESCLSVANKHEGHILRYYKIIVEALDLKQNKMVEIPAKGFTSICFQHEIDHLNGILYYDRIDKGQQIVNRDFSNAIEI